MICAFFQTKSYYRKTTRFDLYSNWKDIWYFFNEQSYALIYVVFFRYCKQILMKKQKGLTHLKWSFNVSKLFYKGQGFSNWFRTLFACWIQEYSWFSWVRSGFWDITYLYSSIFFLKITIIQVFMILIFAKPGHGQPLIFFFISNFRSRYV